MTHLADFFLCHKASFISIHLFKTTVEIIHSTFLTFEIPIGTTMTSLLLFNTPAGRHSSILNMFQIIDATDPVAFICRIFAGAENFKIAERWATRSSPYVLLEPNGDESDDNSPVVTFVNSFYQRTVTQECFQELEITAPAGERSNLSTLVTSRCF